MTGSLLFSSITNTVTIFAEENLSANSTSNIEKDTLREYEPIQVKSDTFTKRYTGDYSKYDLLTVHLQKESISIDSIGPNLEGAVLFLNIVPRNNIYFQVSDLSIRRTLKNLNGGYGPEEFFIGHPNNEKVTDNANGSLMAKYILHQKADEIIFRPTIKLKNNYKNFIDNNGRLPIDFKITGYYKNLQGEQDNLNIEETAYIVFKAADVTAKYMDTEGNKISDDVVQSGNVGDDYSTDQKDIAGYTFKEVQGNPTGQFTDKEQTVTYVYTKNPVKAVDVTAKYVDTEGNKISDDVVKSGNVGDDYSTDQKDIEGYTFKEVQGNPTGQFSDKEQTVTYVYTKNPVKAADVTAKYVDTEGNKISDDVVKSGNVGDDYSTDQKDIEGYTFKEVQGNPTGQFSDKEQTITYVYTKDRIDLATPKPKSDNKPGISLIHHVLPKTGENERLTFISMILGGILLIISLVVSVFQFKRTKK